MITARGLCAALIVLAGAALGLASPASADLSGTYTITYGTGNSATWTVTPCGPGCANVADGGTSQAAPYSGTAQLTAGTWNLMVARADAIRCDSDGSIVAGVNLWSWDATTLSGTEVAEYPPGGACGKPGGTTTAPITFTLTQAS
jgi:hypothetical protein